MPVNLLVNLSASDGGACSILNSWYNRAVISGDSWVFLLSTIELPSTDNVKIINFPQSKKSWWHRIYIDNIYINKYINSGNFDNIYMFDFCRNPRNRYKQIYYMQNFIYYTDTKFLIFSEPKLWIYKNIISLYEKRVIKHANEIIVQADWIKQAINKSLQIPMYKIIVDKFEMVKLKEYKPTNSNTRLFIYPASALSYKNFGIIIEAMKELKKRGYNDYLVCFTLCGNENKYISKIYKITKKFDLPVTWLGVLPHDELLNKLNSSTLIFASKLETVGLPIVEAKALNRPIIIINLPYVKESVGEYNSVEYFDDGDIFGLASILEKHIGENHENRNNNFSLGE